MANAPIRTAIGFIAVPGVAGVTASVGVACGPAMAVQTTVDQADRALFVAKEWGRNLVVVA